MNDVATFFSGMLIGFVFGGLTVLYFWLSALEEKLAKCSLRWVDTHMDKILKLLDEFHKLNEEFNESKQKMH
jgi:hypothetical protein